MSGRCEGEETLSVLGPSVYFISTRLLSRQPVDMSFLHGNSAIAKTFYAIHA
jgi:hypothetical protein